MARSVEEIEREIRSLPSPDRNRLLRDLIADIDGEPEEGIDQAWLDEAHRRYQELQQGIVESIPAEEAIQEARTRLGHET